MLIEIKNDGPLGAIVLQGGSFPTEGIPFFIWMVISLRSRLRLIGHNVCPRWGHRRRSMPLFQPLKFRARF